MIDVPPRYTINTIGDRRTIREILTDHDYELTKRIVEYIFFAIDNELEYIEVAELIMPDEVIVIECTKPKFFLTLNTNMHTLIKYEEYELCAQIKNYLNKLQKSLEI
jgi:hypothetical protein